MLKSRWVDIAKCAAIFAVMTGHLRGALYSSKYIQYASFYSVSLFIMLMGVTTYWSFENSKIVIYKKVLKRLSGILIPYVIAVFIFSCIKYRGFYWANFRDNLINFNASGPHYYVLLYVQMLIISPIIFCFLKRDNNLSRSKILLREITGGGGGYAIAVITNLRSDISGIYATRLFGGSYILCLYIGMLIGKYYSSIEKIKFWRERKFFIATLPLMSVVFCAALLLDNNKFLGSIKNPPGLTLLLYALGVMTFIYCLDKIIIASGRNILYKLENFAVYIGRHTLYIFLYHMLLLSYARKYILTLGILLLEIPVYYLTMILGSMLIEKVVKFCQKFIVDSYLYRKE